MLQRNRGWRLPAPTSTVLQQAAQEPEITHCFQVVATIRRSARLDQSNILQKVLKPLHFSSLPLNGCSQRGADGESVTKHAYTVCSVVSGPRS